MKKIRIEALETVNGGYDDLDKRELDEGNVLRFYEDRTEKLS